MSSSEIQSVFTDYDRYLFSQGAFCESYSKLGAHFAEQNGVSGVRFAVWAPNAKRVSVVGDFNNWDELAAPLNNYGSTGIWEGFVPGVTQGACYKYAIHSNYNGYHMFKIDPYAFCSEVPPRSASVVWDLSDYNWRDEQWMQARAELNRHDRPQLIYEMHLGSWRRNPFDNGRQLSYREIADVLPQYLQEMGFTHVQFLPLMEHPFEGSWGYQSLGYFAPTSRFGTPQDLMYLIDCLHCSGIGVILDWVPGHFPCDEHGLAFYDGTHLYEHADRRQGFHPDWETYIFNYGRNEVAGFLLSSAMFWMDKYHIDGLRVDAVASMLYLDYSRKEGEWVPNEHGGRENLEAISFIKRFNEIVYEHHPDVVTIAEESTSWPMVSRPTYVGGLGFGYKWNMGWMHDVLSYFSKDCIHRKYHHSNLTFGLSYAFSENFVLPFSHDEVVHGKCSLLNKMPGDVWQKYANLRLLYCFMYGSPGKKLLFMGSEIGQWNEWDHDKSLDWHLLDNPSHSGIKDCVRDLNWLVRNEPALHSNDQDHNGFRWVDCHDSSQSVLSFLRYSGNEKDALLFVMNCTPVIRQNYRVGVPSGGYWEELFNSDATVYGGSGMGNMGGVLAEPQSAYNLPYSLSLTLPPLGGLFFRLTRS